MPVVGDQSLSEWLHSNVYAEFDTRHSPGYTTTGGLYRVTVHGYIGHSAAPSFRRTEFDLRQFVPVLHGNWIVAFQARADLTASANGEEVPFFMLPYIGGRDKLPGFENYRFTDRNALLLRGELRWTASPVVDMAVFLDAGTVAASVGALDVHDLQHSWGLGARLHGSTYTRFAPGRPQRRRLALQHRPGCELLRSTMNTHSSVLRTVAGLVLLGASITAASTAALAAAGPKFFLDDPLAREPDPGDASHVQPFPVHSRGICVEPVRQGRQSGPSRARTSTRSTRCPTRAGSRTGRFHTDDRRRRGAGPDTTTGPVGAGPSCQESRKAFAPASR